MNSGQEKIIVKDRKISCEGSEYPYDHPKIYLEMSKDVNHIECPYCSKIFEMDNDSSKFTTLQQ